jgi:sulfotransferase family protein
MVIRDPLPLPNREYFLVIGAPRSGTTLLATMISRHTDVGVLNEDITGKWVRKILGKRVLGNKLCVPNQIQIRRSRVTRSWLKKIGLTDEHPKSAYSIEEYMRIPNFKVVAIVRDGNDTIASMMERGKSSWKKAARRWTQAIETIFSLKNQYGERVFVVSFEDLVLNSEKVIGSLCGHLRLDFQPQILDGYRFNPWYTEDKLNAEKVHRYKKQKPKFEIEAKFPIAFRQYQSLLEMARDRLYSDGATSVSQGDSA